MKELIEDIRKSRLSQDELLILDLYSKLEKKEISGIWTNSIEYTYKGDSFFRYNVNYELMRFFPTTNEYSSISSGKIRKIIKKFNLFSDLKLNDVF